MDDQRINKLADKWLKGTITDPELKELEDWFAQDDASPLEVPTDADENSLQYRLYSKIAERGNLQSAKRKSVRRPWPRIAAAASLLIGMSIAGYFLLHQKTEPIQIAQVQKQDLSPDINQAVLKTGGKVIVLNHISNTQVGNVRINNDQLTYTKSTEPVAVYDTLINPKGSTPYHLLLVDGTKILVNAATTIRYPKTFNGKDRKVELLSGEAYFEVVHNVAMPFSVKTRHMTIEDIGTHFNISAYADEKAVTATLVEGSIKVNNRIIQPGEQAISGEHLTVQKADLEETLAWTNGLFHFDHADLPNVMRQLARVYDVQVVYEGAIPKMTIHGEMYRSLKASQVFEGLDYLKVKFRIEGKKIIVTNK